MVSLGVWKFFTEVGRSEQRLYILDWYHLKENLLHCWWLFEAVAPSRGFALARFSRSSQGAVRRLHPGASPQILPVSRAASLSRIVNYAYFQAEGISIGSGAVESSIKQIDRRLKISGAQWQPQNMPQALQLRCAYLNGQLAV